jgi:hypothetical protein
MSFTIERSVSPPRSGFGKIFSKSSREKKNRDSAENSIKSTDSDSHGLRASLEDTNDKIKGHGDDDDDSNGIKKLMPAIGSRRRKKKQEREDNLRASEEAARGRSVADRGTLDTDVGSVSHNQYGEHDNGQVTYDSDIES